jgi:DNA-binding NarL/FixJ family response regulator
MSLTVPAQQAPRKPGNTPILVIDDHELFSTSLTLMLRSHQVDAHRLPVIDDAEGILAQINTLPVGIALLDLYLGHHVDGQGLDDRGLDGVGLVRPLRALGWAVLVLSGSQHRHRGDEARVAAAIAAGAIGSVSKTATFEVLLDTVLAAAAGKQLMSKQTRGDWLLRHQAYQAQQRERDQRLARLSPREREVLDLLAQGHHAQNIAACFVVSVTTVRAQIRAILAKLDVNSQLEAVALTNHQFRR